MQADTAASKLAVTPYLWTTKPTPFIPTDATCEVMGIGAVIVGSNGIQYKESSTTWRMLAVWNGKRWLRARWLPATAMNVMNVGPGVAYHIGYAKSVVDALAMVVDYDWHPSQSEAKSVALEAQPVSPLATGNSIPASSLILEPVPLVIVTLPSWWPNTASDNAAEKPPIVDHAAEELRAAADAVLSGALFQVSKRLVVDVAAPYRDRLPAWALSDPALTLALWLVSTFGATALPRTEGPYGAVRTGLERVSLGAAVAAGALGADGAYALTSDVLRALRDRLGREGLTLRDDGALDVAPRVRALPDYGGLDARLGAMERELAALDGA